MYNWKLPDVNWSLNGCIIFNWNSDVLCFFKRKTWHVQYDFENVFFSIPNLTRCRTIKLKCDAFSKVSFQNHAFKKAPKMRNMPFSRSKMNQNVVFWMETFLQKWHVQNFFIQNLTRCSFSIQNLTLRKTFYSKSDAFWNFYFKIWRVGKIAFQIWQVLKLFLRNLIFMLFFAFSLKDDIFCQR